MKNLQLFGILLKNPYLVMILYQLVPNVLTEFHNFEKETTTVESVIVYHNAEMPPPPSWLSCSNDVIQNPSKDYFWMDEYFAGAICPPFLEYSGFLWKQ